MEADVGPREPGHDGGPANGVDPEDFYAGQRSDEGPEVDAGPRRSRPRPDASAEFERGLAPFVLVREEREGEVRLLFRDVSARELALSFRSEGADLISITAERAAEPGTTAQAGADRVRRRAGRQPAHPTEHPGGDVLLIYFYSLADLVYTASIASSAGVGESIATVFPGAALAETEITTRMGIPFTR